MALFASLAIAGGLAAIDSRTVAASSAVVVHHGQTIQTALDNAAPGTTIRVEAGTYAENLNISKDGIALKGDGARKVHIVPPTSLAPFCGEQPSSSYGICVADVVGFDPNTGPITQTVHGVHISGISVDNFTGAGIFLADSSGARIDHVRSMNNGGYGMFALQSTGTHITDSTASGNHEAGFYVGDSPHADAVLSGNDSHGNQIGIFFRDARGGRITDNELTGNCAGMVVLNTGSLPTGVGDVTVEGNDVSRNNAACPGSADTGPGTSGIGIAILGGDHIVLRDNTVAQNVASTTDTVGTGGILLLPGADPNGTPANHITVRDNTLRRNATDIVVVVPLATNAFTDNDCRTSSPPGLCGD